MHPKIKQTMKKLFVLSALALVGLANAQTEKGSWVVGGSTTLGFNSANTKYKYDGNSTDGPKVSTFTITPSVGYFVIDKLAIGIDLGYTSLTTKMEDTFMGTNYSAKTTLSTFSILPTATYYFKSDSKVLPYIGAGAGYSTSKEKFTQTGTDSNDYEDNLNGFAWKGKGGIVFLVTPSIGIDLGVSYMGTNGKYDDDSDAKVQTNTFGVNAGISVFLK